MVDFKQDAKEIASYFMDITNNYAFDYKKLAEELKSNKEMRKLSILWLKTISSYYYRTRLVDGRNEIAAKKGQELAEVPFLQNKIANLNDDAKLEKVVELISYSHRTLQQTFTKFVFYFIYITCTAKQQEKLINQFGESFYRLPLI